MTRELLTMALDALTHHVEQTRPIDRTDVAIQALRSALARQEAGPSVLQTSELWRKGMAEKLTEAAQQAQPTGKAPCARQCEATAFQIEIRELKRALEQAQPPAPDLKHKPAVQRLMDLARRFRSTPGDLYDGAYKELERACYEALATAPAAPAVSAVPDSNLVESHLIRTVPAVQPLTDEQADLVLQRCGIRANYDTLRELVHAVEQAHGIAAPGSADHG